MPLCERVSLEAPGDVPRHRRLIARWFREIQVLRTLEHVGTRGNEEPTVISMPGGDPRRYGGRSGQRQAIPEDPRWGVESNDEGSVVRSLQPRDRVRCLPLVRREPIDDAEIEGVRGSDPRRALESPDHIPRHDRRIVERRRVAQP